ncbi:MAG TPA: hypothetical protein VFU46_13810 [Gemmatimonadales bacterium]|nr:hypothetical protein [Gemmatimonadales bacterium]
MRDRMVAESMLPERDYERGIAEFREWGRRPDAGFWYAVPWVEGVRAE